VSASTGEVSPDQVQMILERLDALATEQAALRSLLESQRIPPG
jgi:hypothetical protein